MSFAITIPFSPIAVPRGLSSAIVCRSCLAGRCASRRWQRRKRRRRTGSCLSGLRPWGPRFRDWGSRGAAGPTRGGWRPHPVSHPPLPVPGRRRPRRWTPGPPCPQAPPDRRERLAGRRPRRQRAAGTSAPAKAAVRRRPRDFLGARRPSQREAKPRNAGLPENHCRRRALTRNAVAWRAPLVTVRCAMMLTLITTLNAMRTPAASRRARTARPRAP